MGQSLPRCGLDGQCRPDMGLLTQGGYRFGQRGYGCDATGSLVFMENACLSMNETSSEDTETHSPVQLRQPGTPVIPILTFESILQGVDTTLHHETSVPIPPVHLMRVGIHEILIAKGVSATHS